MTDGGNSFPPPSNDSQPSAEVSEAAGTPKPWWRKWWVITIAVVVVLGVIGSIAGGGDDADDEATPVATAESEQTDPPEETDGPEETTMFPKRPTLRPRKRQLPLSLQRRRPHRPRRLRPRLRFRPFLASEVAPSWSASTPTPAYMSLRFHLEASVATGND